MVINNSSCDVVDLVLSEKKINLVFNSNYNARFELESKTFDKAILISKEEILSNLVLPVDSKILNVHIKRISAIAISKEGNQAGTLNFNGYIIQAGTNNLMSWKDNHSLLIINNNTEELSLITNTNSIGLGELKNQIFSLINGDQTESITFGVRSVLLDQINLIADLKVVIEFDVEIEYCGLVPGNSDLPDCGG